MSVATQTTALFVDAYREMNAKRMFWITLILSALVIAAFAFVGIKPDGLSIFGARIPVPNPAFWYKWVFSFFLIGIWAKWGALVLALISTAGIFPDLISGGAIDLYLSKPIARLRLFFTKFLGGLLFVVLQTTVFAVGSYLIFGVRGGQWRPSLFMMIPLIVLLYSYLFCVCVLIGVLTRSTITAILLTVLFWFLCFGINAAENGLFAYKTLLSAQARGYEREVRQIDDDIDALKTRPSALNAFGFREALLRRRREEAVRQAEQMRTDANKFGTFHRVAYGVATVIPKTGETVNLLDRKLFSEDDVAAMQRGSDDNGRGFGEPPPSEYELPPSTPTTGPTTNPAEAAAQEAVRALEAGRAREERRRIAEEAAEETGRAARSRSVPWIIGTSMGFEAIILAWAAWVFCRRDY